MAKCDFLVILDRVCNELGPSDWVITQVERQESGEKSQASDRKHLTRRVSALLDRVRRSSTNDLRPVLRSPDITSPKGSGAMLRASIAPHTVLYQPGQTPLRPNRGSANPAAIPREKACSSCKQEVGGKRRYESI